MTRTVRATHNPPRPTLSGGVASELRARVYRGDYAAGSQLPAEPELSEEFGVSRATIRSAITELVTELLLEKRRGIGTFVREATNGPSHGFERLVGLTEAIHSVGATPTVDGLLVQRVEADAELTGAFGVPEGRPLWRVERTWLVDEKPAVHGVDWVPEEILPQGHLDDLTEADSLSERLSRAGIQIVSAMSRIRPERAGPRIADRLSLDATDPVMLIRQIHYDENPPGRAVLFSDQYWGGHALQLHIVRRAIN